VIPRGVSPLPEIRRHSGTDTSHPAALLGGLRFVLAAKRSEDGCAQPGRLNIAGDIRPPRALHDGRPSLRHGSGQAASLLSTLLETARTGLGPLGTSTYLWDGTPHVSVTKRGRKQTWSKKQRVSPLSKPYHRLRRVRADGRLNSLPSDTLSRERQNPRWQAARAAAPAGGRPPCQRRPSRPRYSSTSFSYARRLLSQLRDSS
jgi:hypothetical protein